MAATKKAGGTVAKRTVGAPPKGGLDLDAVADAYEPLPFKIGGKWYQAANLNLLDYRLVEAADSGRLDALSDILQAAVGDQWPEVSKNRLGMGVLQTLFLEMLSHAGLRQGESPAS